jgi:hypothetical protein
MDRCELPDNCLVTYYQPGHLTSILKDLGHGAKDYVREDLAPFSDLCDPIDEGMRTDYSPGPHGDIRADDRKGAYATAWSKLGLRCNNR